jgi:hypothetical protein
MTPDKIRSLLNTLFLLGALASVLIYFLVADKTIFFYVCIVTLCIKVIEFIIRFTFR